MTLSVKDQIIELLRAEGYDYISAAREATRVIKEFMESDKVYTTLYTKSGRAISLQKTQST